MPEGSFEVTIDISSNKNFGGSDVPSGFLPGSSLKNVAVLILCGAVLSFGIVFAAKFKRK